MIKYTILFSFIFFYSTMANKNETAPDADLVFVKVLFRNGKQPPPKHDDLIKFLRGQLKFELEPFQVDDLTKSGEAEIYDFGVKLRRWYSHKLFSGRNSKINSNNVQVRSTLHKGCQKSAKIVETAILTKDMKKWKTEALNGLSNNSEDDLLRFFYKDSKCSVNDSMRYNVGNKFNSFKPYYTTRNTIADNLEAKPKKIHPGTIQPQQMWKISEYYEAMRNNDENLPDWLTENMILDMKESNELFMQTIFNGDYVKQMSGGVYANMLLDEFDKAVKNKQQLKMQILCAQDIVVAAAISAIAASKETASTICEETFTANVPKHGAALIAELHEGKGQQNNNYYVKIFYWDAHADEPKQLKYKHCTGECSLDRFKELLNKTRITEDKLKNNCGIP